jgi:hypothetical protein
MVSFSESDFQLVFKPVLHVTVVEGLEGCFCSGSVFSQSVVSFCP